MLSAGAARGIRTPDPIITNDVLYRLSYCGINDLAGKAPLCVRTVSANRMRIGGIGAGERGYSMI
jgi:hypothetical protein